ncbi:MAG: cbb3-type cytochrome c oxidase subunit I, partial [Phycisphaeraceae bacterium]
DAGWFSYTPLSGPQHAGISQDFWLLGLALVEIAGITTAAEIAVTILKCRAPGMTLTRMPLFAWAMLITSLMIIFAFTTLLMATVLLELDRTLGTQFFNTAAGGSDLLWQHLFWFFGHPEVYIMFIPATGIVSMITAAFAGRLVGYTLIAVAIVLTGFLSFGLWVHHMYTTGLPELAMHFFAAASLMIAIASGIQVFAWIATLWGTRPALKTPLLFILGFLFLFVLGGFTGVMVAVVPFDWQVHDTFFLVAHFHYVLIGGVVFPIFAGLHYWMPKITGRMLSDRLGVWSFWFTFIGFNGTFFPMHLMGFFGQPRRVYTYAAELGIGGYNMLATVAAFIFAMGTLLFLVNLALSLRRGQQADDNPWDGDTLEWAVASPPPVYGHLGPPLVIARHPLWQAQRHEADSAAPDERTQHIVAALHGQPTQWRGTLITDVLYAQPQAIQWLPKPTYAPLIAALGVLVGAVATLYQYYLVLPFALLLTAVIVVAWLWPRDSRLAMLDESEQTLGAATGLPVFATGTASVGWWGMVALLGVLATAFAVLFYAYLYLWLFSEQWPQDNLPRPGLAWSGAAFGVLVFSSVPQWWARRRHPREHRRPAIMGLTSATLLAALFLVWQVVEYANLPFKPQTNAYASMVFVTHFALSVTLLTALALNIAAIVRLRHKYEPVEHTGLQCQLTSMFWHFTVVVAVLVYAVIYALPYLIGT